MTNTWLVILIEKLVRNLNLAANLQYAGQRWYDAGLGLHLQPSPFGGVPAGLGPLGMVGGPGGNAYASRVSSGGGSGLDLLGNPLMTFTLNKALISPNFPEQWNISGWAEYKIARYVAPILQNTPDFVTFGWGYERILTNYAVDSFRPGGETRIVSRSVWVEDRLGFKLWGSFPTQQIRTFGFETIVPIEYEGFRHTFGLGKLVRGLAHQGPLFLLDAAFNGYVQYQDEANLPEGLRRGRAIAGGIGNAGVSALVATRSVPIAGAALATICGVSVVCAEGVIVGGAIILGADLLANWVFDEWLKEPALDVIGLGSE